MEIYKMKNTYKTLLASTVLIASFSAYAGGMSLNDFDTDKSGTVSEQEFNTTRDARIAEKVKEGRKMRGLANLKSFAELDANHDGQLSADEIGKMSMGHGKKGQGKNGKGKGMGKPPEPTFAEFDTNSDGSLTEKEFNDARNARIGERVKEGRKMKGLASMASFTDMDSNADGKVATDEFASFLADHKKKSH